MKPLGRSALFARLRAIVDEPRWSVRVTLASGDLLFGDIFTHLVPRTWQGRSETHVPQFWHKEREPDTAVRLDPFAIIYNTSRGDVHGAAWVTTIPVSQVVSVDRVHWDLFTQTPEELGVPITRFAHNFKNLPNPFATIIEQHNQNIAEHLGLDTTGYFEAAMSVSHIAQHGIQFTQPELLYADYTFFERLPATNFSASALGMGVSATAGIHDLVFAALRDTTISRLRIGDRVERRVGMIELGPPDVTTELEDAEWLLLFLHESALTHTHRVPVLFKRNAVSYPREFWPHIRSPLTVIGELRQIPLAHETETWQEVVTARAIGFVG